MSVSEILTELESLSSDELSVIQEKMDQLRPTEYFETTPEELETIDEGLRSLKEEGHIPIEDVLKEIPTWNTKYS